MDRDKLTPTEAYIQQEEGFRAKPYRCTSGALTIGIGWNLDAGITWEEAVMIFRHRLAGIQTHLRARMPWFAGLNEARQAALVSMAFQMGIQGLFSFKRALKAVEDGDWDKAGREMLDSKWARQTPKRARRTAYMMRYGKFPTLWT